MSGAFDYLAPILARKRRENMRRAAHSTACEAAGRTALVTQDRAQFACAKLRRPAAAFVRVIAEIKLKSPSAGVIRARRPGLVEEIARGYAQAGAAAVSVLCDGPGFGGSVLDLRRAARAVSVPLLFKEFVLSTAQVELAREVGAHMVLLIVRALAPSELDELVAAVIAHGMAPVVEARDETELEAALRTRATIVGVNARDLSTFRVDPERARRAIASVPSDRIVVLMSGIASPEALAHAADSRADAVLVGEALMRAESPGARLGEWLGAVGTARG